MMAKWVMVRHPLFNKPAAVVHLDDDGAVVGFILVHDLRDGDWDGKISNGERALPHIPIFGKQAIQTELASIMLVIATDDQVLDDDLERQAKRKMISAAVTAVQQSISMIFVKRFCGPLFQTALAGTGLSAVGQFFAKKGLEKAMQSAVNEAIVDAQADDD
jgi:hypothetical protein